MGQFFVADSVCLVFFLALNIVHLNKKKVYVLVATHNGLDLVEVGKLNLPLWLAKLKTGNVFGNSSPRTSAIRPSALEGAPMHLQTF